MNKENLKYFLHLKDKVVLRNATEEQVQEKIKSLLQEAATAPVNPSEDPRGTIAAKDFKVVLGREIDAEIDTGIRVNLKKRSHKKDKEDNGAPKVPKIPKTRKPRTPAVAVTTATPAPADGAVTPVPIDGTPVPTPAAASS